MIVNIKDILQMYILYTFLLRKIPYPKKGETWFDIMLDITFDWGEEVIGLLGDSFSHLTAGEISETIQNFIYMMQDFDNKSIEENNIKQHYKEKSIIITGILWDYLYQLNKHYKNVSNRGDG